MSREVMDIREAAGYLGLGVTKVYQLVERRAIPASRVGQRQYRFLKKALDTWLIQNIIMKDPEFFKLLTQAQQDFVKAGYTEEDIAQAVEEVRRKK